MQGEHRPESASQPNSSFLSSQRAQLYSQPAPPLPLTLRYLPVCEMGSGCASSPSVEVSASAGPCHAQSCLEMPISGPLPLAPKPLDTFQAELLNHELCLLRAPALLSLKSKLRVRNEVNGTALESDGPVCGIQPLLPSSCVTLGKRPLLSWPWFPHLKHENRTQLLGALSSRATWLGLMSWHCQLLEV